MMRDYWKPTEAVRSPTINGTKSCPETKLRMETQKKYHHEFNRRKYQNI